MIDRLTKEILDQAYAGFPTNDQVASINRFSSNNVKMLSIAIRKMFDLLHIEKDINIIDSIRVFELDAETFCYAYYCSISDENYEYSDGVAARDKAIKEYKKIDLSMTDLEIEKQLQDFNSLVAHANKCNILVNSKSVCPQMGLHLICHEIMHSLASPVAVQTLRDNNGNDCGLYGDEAINEFFARLASLIFNSIDEQRHPEITGYSIWNNQDFFNGKIHSCELGLYGTLMASDKCLQNEKWNNSYDAVEYAKELAKFYFLNE